MTPQDIILAALGIMRGGHWTRRYRKLHRDGGGSAFCALGAVGEAAIGDVNFNERIEVGNGTPIGQALELLGAQIPPDFEGDTYGDFFGIGGRVADYNNTREDFAEIEDWFIKAATAEVNL